MIAEANKRRSGKAWFWLAEIELQTDASASRWALLTSRSEPTVLDGETYNPWPFSFDKVDSGEPGDLAQVRLRISNVGGYPGGLLRDYAGLSGRRVVLRMAHEDLLASAGDSRSWTFEVVAASASGPEVTLTLGHAPLHRLAFPSGRFTRYACRFRFRDARCGWTTSDTGDPDACDRTLDGANGCEAHGNTNRFGGFPAMPDLR